MNRRQFINLMSMETAVLLLATQVQAQTSISNSLMGKDWGHDNWEGFFVTVIFGGAWDTSLSLDPWLLAQRPGEKEYFIEYTPDNLRPWGPRALGPAMQVMSPHFKDLSIINGIFMSTNDNGHESLQNYAISGDSKNQRAAFNLELNATLPPSQFSVLTDRPIPVGIRANKTTDFNIAENSINQNSQDLAKSFIQNANRGILKKVKDAQKNKNQLELAQKLLAEYKKTLPIIENSNFNSLAIAAASFQTGLSRSAVLSPRVELDTHSAHPGKHLAEQIKGWSYLNELFKLFKSVEYKPGKSLFEMTTFLVTSEFTRTPALNTAKGKDHNPWTNSALLAGRGIKGGVVEGASHLVEKADSSQGISYMTGLSYDYLNNKVVEKRSDLNESSAAVLPQNVLRTVSDAMGLNLKVIGGGLGKVEPFKTLIKRG
jgi:hypothetical protein